MDANKLGSVRRDIMKIKRLTEMLRLTDESEAEAEDENLNREVELLEEEEDRIVDDNIANRNIEHNQPVEIIEHNPM